MRRETGQSQAASLQESRNPDVQNGDRSIVSKKGTAPKNEGVAIPGSRHAPGDWKCSAERGDQLTVAPAQEAVIRAALARCRSSTSLETLEGSTIACPAVRSPMAVCPNLSINRKPGLAVCVRPTTPLDREYSGRWAPRCTYVRSSASTAASEIPQRSGSQG